MAGVSQRDRFKRIALTALTGILIAGAAHAEELVRVGGAGSGLGGMRLLARAFEASHPGVKVNIFPSLGSSGGIKALLSGALDLAVSGRPLKEEERKRGAAAQEYARTPFVFAANNSVAKTDITTAELERIYLGQLLKWPDGSQIRLVLRPDGDTNTKIVKAISPALDQAARAAASRPGMIFAVTDQECDEALVKTAGALGPSTLAEIVTEKRALRVLSFNGVKPTVKALADGKYPLAKLHFLVTTAKATAATRQFVHFVGSAKGRAILAKVGYLVPAEGKGR
jgi:phosphate transport system substrate-binding protein